METKTRLWLRKYDDNGFNKSSLKHDGKNALAKYNLPGDILFMNTESKKELK